ncbi:hypothetical protein [Luteimonas aquatica]|uniref:hypothetical protein n=1 Tax=Luteimonas aquatica TaxID=450364 RepID=UPI001F5AB355|nr:hypothetical protein [Luteimonas aquatica]
MPSEIVRDPVVRPILEIVLRLFGDFTGRVVVPLFTFGHAYVEPAVKGVRISPKWHGFHRASDGRRVVAAEMGAFLGLAFWGPARDCHLRGLPLFCALTIHPGPARLPVHPISASEGRQRCAKTRSATPTVPGAADSAAGSASARAC